MKTINLFLKAHFTSLSPDGQFISLAIVSSERHSVSPSGVNPVGVVGYESKHIYNNEKSFYAEFSDFDINRCDDWVKDNVISKLKYLNKKEYTEERKSCPSWNCFGNTNHINLVLNEFFKQFSDYKINFVVDCGWFCWGKFVELMGEWENKKVYSERTFQKQREVGITEVSVGANDSGISPSYIDFKVGLPKLPANFPPVPQDLNDLIALRRGVSVSEAFELDREKFIDESNGFTWYKSGEEAIKQFCKFNSAWDVKVTKAIYEKFI